MDKRDKRMLYEIKYVRQIEGERKRRWFTSNTMDLIVWHDGADQIVGFQFSYDKSGAERAVTWTPERGFSHLSVDDGESVQGAHYKASPLLGTCEPLDHAMVKQAFDNSAVNVPPEINAFVNRILEEHTPA